MIRLQTPTCSWQVLFQHHFLKQIVPCSFPLSSMIVAFFIPGSSNRSQAIQFQFRETTLQSPMRSLSWDLLELGSVIHPNAFPLSTIVQMNDSPKAYSLDPAPWNTTPVAIAPRERTIYNYYLKNMVLVNSCTPTYINYSVESDMSCDQKN